MSDTPQLGAPVQPVPIAMKQPSILPRPALVPGMLPLMPPFFNPGATGAAPRGMPLLPANMAGMAGMASLAGMASMGSMAGMQARMSAMAAAAKAAGGLSMPQGIVGMNAFSVVMPQKAKLGNIAPRPAGMSRRPLLAPPTKAGRSASGTKRPRLTSTERLERSRERNRIHARKTRQRKKMVMTQMQDQLKALHEAGLKLRQSISERKTANILLSMSSVPDSEMPALPVPIEFRPEDLQHVKNEDLDRLAGNQDDDDDDDDDGEGEGGSGDDTASGDDSGSEDGQPTRRGAKRRRSDDGDSSVPLNDDEETDPDLMEKHRRERNRMHAKRTRVRKKHVMDETSKMIDRLERQNAQLVEYLSVLEGGKQSGKPSSRLATPEPGLGPEKASSPTNGKLIRRDWSPTSAGIAGMLASMAS